MSQARTSTKRRRGKAHQDRAARMRTVVRDLAGTLSTLSHDLRNPLTAIAWNAPLLRRLLAPDHPGHARLDMVSRSTDEMIQMLDDMSEASRILLDELTLALAWCDVTALVEEVVAACRPAAEARHIVLSVEAGSALPEVCCDRERIARVLARLLADAIRVTPKGGAVIVRAHASTGAGHEGVCLAIEDGGPGLSPEECATTFDLPTVSAPGQPRRVRVRGLGLSLFVARGVIEAHGGRIWVEGAPGASRLLLTLPRGSAGSDQPPIILAR